MSTVTSTVSEDSDYYNSETLRTDKRETFVCSESQETLRMMQDRMHRCIAASRHLVIAESGGL